MGTGQMEHLQGSEAQEVSKYIERILRIMKNRLKNIEKIID